MNANDINKIVADHALWLASRGGQRADLAAKDLSWAYLRLADLSWADLSGVDLSWANLSRADLRRADLRQADLSEAYLRGADLSGADLRGATLPDLDIPVVPDIDAAILRAIESGGELDTKTWHTCETTHSRAGWAVTLAGDAGRKLESQVGTSAAAALIYAMSRPDRRVPDWYASNEEAMADIRVCAAQQ